MTKHCSTRPSHFHLALTTFTTVILEGGHGKGNWTKAKYPAFLSMQSVGVPNTFLTCQAQRVLSPTGQGLGYRAEITMVTYQQNTACPTCTKPSKHNQTLPQTEIDFSLHFWIRAVVIDPLLIAIKFGNIMQKIELLSEILPFTCHLGRISTAIKSNS